MGNAKYKNSHKQLGLCTDCSEPVFANGTRCLKHLRTHREYGRSEVNRKRDRLVKQRYKDSGRCPTCGKPLDIDADKNHVKCINCREYVWN